MDQSTDASLRDLCHRLSSPLGALVNHLYMLEMDQAEFPDTARASLAAAQEVAERIKVVLDTGRRWSDVRQRSLAIESLPVAEVAELLGSKAAGEALVRADKQAICDMAADLRTDGSVEGVSVVGEELQVRTRLRPELAVAADRPERALDPFGATGSAPRLACAAALALRMGGRVTLNQDQNGETCALLCLPLHRTEEGGR